VILLTLPVHLFVVLLLLSGGMALKATVRLDMKKRLKLLSSDEIAEQSRAVLSRLSELPSYISSNSACMYLSMGGEVNTETLLTDSFQRRKKVFIPKIMGKNSADMFMLEVSSMETIQGFEKNNWGIPEPSKELILASADGTYSGLIDLVLLPGVAFDKYCNRLGHGKGYYGE